MLHERLCQQVDEQLFDVEDFEYFAAFCGALDRESRSRAAQFRETRSSPMALADLALVRSVFARKTAKNRGLHLVRDAGRGRVQTHMQVALRLPVKVQEFAAVG